MKELDLEDSTSLSSRSSSFISTVNDDNLHELAISRMSDPISRNSETSQEQGQWITAEPGYTVQINEGKWRTRIMEKTEGHR